MLVILIIEMIVKGCIIDFWIIINMLFLLIFNYFLKCYIVDVIYQDDYGYENIVFWLKKVNFFWCQNRC